MRKSGDYLLERRIVAESLADVGEAVYIPQTKNKRPTQLERVLSQLVLTVSGSFGPLARSRIVAAEQMEDVRLFQPKAAIRREVLVHEQREINAGLLAEGARVLHASEADRDNAGTMLFDLRFMRAQLRDVLPAEDSTPVAQKNDDRRLFSPELAQSDSVAVNIRQLEGSELATERLRHPNILR